jgi:3'-phosphoadenosine 5'-phosphosulfate sulfotransferase (PAPS reductase)/FAD synthetase
MISEFLLREQGYSTISDSTCFSVVKEKVIEEVNEQFYSADTSCSQHRFDKVIIEDKRVTFLRFYGDPKHSS